jgi:hypothetical protein
MKRIIEDISGITDRKNRKKMIDANMPLQHNQDIIFRR